MIKDAVQPGSERFLLLLLIAGLVVLIVSFIGTAIRETQSTDPRTFYEQEIIKTDAH